ncbi:MAG: hypothetical protein AAF202_00105, partial [Pseudomonadota bacterium]
MGLKEGTFYHTRGMQSPNRDFGYVNFVPMRTGLLDFEAAFMKRGVHMINSPYTDLLSNKALLPYLEGLNKLYFPGSRDLILASAPSKTFILDYTEEGSPWDGYEVTPSRERVLTELMKTRNQVLKVAGVDRGAGVHMITDQSTPLEEYRQTTDRVIRDIQSHAYQHGLRPLDEGKPQLLVVTQDYIPSSYIPFQESEFNVDLRPLAVKSGHASAFVAETFWGRAQSRKAGQLSNIAQGGMSLAVMTSQCSIQMAAE